MNTPPPGSDEAIALGCTCPVLDNGHGKRTDGLFWICEDCPLHGSPRVDEDTSQDGKNEKVP